MMKPYKFNTLGLIIGTVTLSFALTAQIGFAQDSQVEKALIANQNVQSPAEFQVAEDFESRILYGMGQKALTIINQLSTTNLVIADGKVQLSGTKETLAYELGENYTALQLLNLENARISETAWQLLQDYELGTITYSETQHLPGTQSYAHSSRLPQGVVVYSIQENNELLTEAQIVIAIRRDSNGTAKIDISSQ